MITDRNEKWGFVFRNESIDMAIPIRTIFHILMKTSDPRHLSSIHNLYVNANPPDLTCGNPHRSFSNTPDCKSVSLKQYFGDCNAD
jgi:hypothetical protein